MFLCSMFGNGFLLAILLFAKLYHSQSEAGTSLDFANLHKDHVKYFEYGGASSIKSCSKDNCKFRDSPQILKSKEFCWGYEPGCKPSQRFSFPNCYSHDQRWAATLEDQQKIFWDQADFGYLKNFMDGIVDICKPRMKGDSSLRCAANLVYCEAKNILIDFRNVNFATSSDRYKENLFREGEIGGHCELNRNLLSKQGAHKSPLQSWYAELENYSYIKQNPIDHGLCDVVLDKPTYFIKLDAGINMYHHFCDFVNLYASQHMNGSFSTDVYIVMWDTSNYGYRDFFEDTWKAFTDYPIIRLDQYQRKKICAKDVVFPLLARMMRGLYYNMPLVPSCENSGLFKAFSEHVLHRLGIMQENYVNEVYRITLLVRNTKYRNILNQDELIGAMKRYSSMNVTVKEYNPSLSFLEQLKITHNTDIFVGMHGAGLTHSLFLPDWAVLFELYNTEDPDCYHDLARLRGIRYITWQNRDLLFQQDKGHHPTLGEHPKFTNYAFNVHEFMRLMEDGIHHVNNARPKRKN